jgi:hypothetical protein
MYRALSLRRLSRPSLHHCYNYCRFSTSDPVKSTDVSVNMPHKAKTGMLSEAENLLRMNAELVEAKQRREDKITQSENPAPMSVAATPPTSVAAGPVIIAPAAKLASIAAPGSPLPDPNLTPNVAGEVKGGKPPKEKKVSFCRQRTTTKTS